eukprot:gene3126-biopygen17153
MTDWQRRGSKTALLGEQDTGAGVARAIGICVAWDGAGVARAWRGRGAGMSCSPWSRDPLRNSKAFAIVGLLSSHRTSRALAKTGRVPSRQPAHAQLPFCWHLMTTCYDFGTVGRAAHVRRHGKGANSSYVYFVLGIRILFPANLCLPHASGNGNHFVIPQDSLLFDLPFFTFPGNRETGVPPIA